MGRALDADGRRCMGLRRICSIVCLLGLMGGTGCSDAGSDDLPAFRAPPTGPRPGCRSTDVLAIPVGDNVGYAALDEALASGRLPADWQMDVNQSFGQRTLDLEGACCDDLLCVEASLAVMPGLSTSGPEAVVQVSLVTGLQAVELPEAGRTFVVTVDASGSLLSLQRIGFVKDALHELIDSLEDDAIFGLLAFDAVPRVLVEAQRMADVRAQAHAEVDALTAGGGTNLSLGLQAAFLEAQRVYDSQREHRVLLVTDGNDPRNQVEADVLSNQLQPFHAQGIQLTVFGVGDANEQDWLRPLAQGADGRFLEDDGAENLGGLVTDELGRRYRPIATELELRVRPPEGVVFGRHGGWSPPIRGDGILRAQLSAVLLGPDGDLVTPGQGEEGGPALVADFEPSAQASGAGDMDVVLSFNPALGGSREVVRAPVALPEEWPAVAAGGYTPRPAAQEALLARHVGQSLYEAVQLWSAGDRNEAIRLVAQLEAVLSDYPLTDTGPDQDVANDLSRVNQLRRRMEGLVTQRPTVDVPTDPWPGN